MKANTCMYYIINPRREAERGLLGMAFVSRANIQDLGAILDIIMRYFDVYSV